jgi:hypothetical protein
LSATSVAAAAAGADDGVNLSTGGNQSPAHPSSSSQHEKILLEKKISENEELKKFVRTLEEVIYQLFVAFMNIIFIHCSKLLCTSQHWRVQRLS